MNSDLTVKDNTLTELEYESSYFGFDFLRITLTESVLSRAMLIFLLIYKIGEQGSMNMLPLFLLDLNNTLSKIGFWTGILGQFSSIIGSAAGHRLQTIMECPVISILKLMIVRVMLQCPLFLISLPFVGETYPTLVFYSAVVLMNSMLFVSGAITTIVFTLMMQCTRSEAPKMYEATHYTILSTAELLGKLLFGSISGYLTDKIGYCFAYFLFIQLSLLPIYFVRKYEHIFHFRDEQKHEM